MLQKLHIQNYAIIDELIVEFPDKLSIITGETGAGKSILMGALSLILGDRADTSVLRDREKKCYVEGIFQSGGKKEVAAFCKTHELDGGEEIVIRREISINGKSRAFVNDTPVNLEQLRTLSSLLVDLHRQFDTQELGESDFQREVLDALAGQGEALGKYREQFRALAVSLRELAVLQERKAQFTREYDYHKFLFDELEEAGFRDHELEELDNELKLLNNAEGIKTALSKVYYDLKEGEQPIVQQLKIFSNQLNGFSAFHPGLSAILERIRSVQIELQDIAGEIETLNEQVQYDPQRILQINERISAGYKLCKKHGVSTTSELIGIQVRLGEKLKAVLDIDQLMLAKQKEVDTLSGEIGKLAAVLSKNRHAQVLPLEKQVNALLQQVGMPNARLKVQIESIEPGPSGMDAIAFLFDANKSNRFEPIRKVASGGELSRLMLCIKSLVARSIDLPTLLFDEIDTGISGEAAKQVGIILKNLSKSRQVICITHQPQIAGKADAHYFVYKETRGDAIKTGIRILSTDERITAIAKMLSGEKPTAAALENAREMVMN